MIQEHVSQSNYCCGQMSTRFCFGFEPASQKMFHIYWSWFCSKIGSESPRGGLKEAPKALSEFERCGPRPHTNRTGGGVRFLHFSSLTSSFFVEYCFTCRYTARSMIHAAALQALHILKICTSTERKPWPPLQALSDGFFLEIQSKFHFYPIYASTSSSRRHVVEK